MNDRKLKFMIVLFTIQMGGAERVAISYCNWLVEHTDEEVYLLVLNKKNDIYRIDNRVKIIEVNNQQSSKLIGAYCKYKELRNIIKDIKPDIIFTMFLKSSIYMLLSKPKVSALISSERAHIQKRNYINRKLCKCISKKCDGFIFQTNRIQKMYPKKTIQNSIVIQNAVSNSLKITGELKKENTITAMGRLSYQKGFDTLIKAFKKFSDELHGYKLIILGEGEEREKLENLIEVLNLKDSVFLVGNKKEALEYICKSKLFVLSSRFEGMPNALLEAMGTGTACISTDCEFGPNEVIDNYKNGILVNVDDVDMLAEKMKEVILDSKLRKDLEKNSQKILITNSKDAIYKKYYEYMKKICLKKNKKNSKTFFERCFFYLIRHGYLNFMPDKIYLRLLYRLKMHEKLDLKNPRNFNEKLQWLKLYNRKSLYTQMVDKYEVKEYVGNLIGEKFIIKTLGVYNKVSEIDFSKLPHKFVIKTTHDSGGIVICRDKNIFDKEANLRKIEDSLKVNYFYGGREWPYKNVKPRIIIEEYMEDEKSTELKDYKFFCFNGKVKFTLVCSERFSSDNMCKTFFDKDWKIIPVTENNHPIDKNIQKPLKYEKMVQLAEKLANNIPFVRVDFYSIKDKIYFGEITFFPSSGFEKFNPDDYNLLFGDWINIKRGNNHEK